MRFFCIADEDTVRGFRLAGIEGQAVASSEEAGTAIEEALTQTDCGVIIITQKVAADISLKIKSIRAGMGHPLIVEIPGPEGPLPGRKSLKQFVQEAVGIRVA